MPDAAIYMPETLGEYSGALNSNQIEEGQQYLFDSFSYLRIFRGLQLFDKSQMPIRKLKEIVKLPLPKEENPGDAKVNPRNYLFELELGAHMLSCGVKVHKFEDIFFEFYGYDFAVQCKRLHSERNIEYNTFHALGQLKCHLTNPRRKGIIALALDKIIHIDNHPLGENAKGFDNIRLQVSSANAIDKEVDRLALNFERENSATLDKITDRNVNSIFLVLRFLGRLEPKGTFFGSFFICLIILKQTIHPDSQDEKILRKLASRFVQK